MCSNIQLIASYGVEYRLEFSLITIPGFTVAGATSRVIVAKPCAKSQFYVTGDTFCSKCPEGAVCNGSNVLLTQVWRGGFVWAVVLVARRAPA